SVAGQAICHTYLVYRFLSSYANGRRQSGVATMVPSGVTMIPVRRVGHATFETTDLDRQVAYYSDVIGLSVLARTPKLAILGTPFGQEVIAFERGTACRCTRVAFQVAPGFEQSRLTAELTAVGLPSEPRSAITPAIPQAVVFKDPKGTEIELFTEHN